ncbi:hypothetical protein SEA_BEXAN_89 [Mycobacterium phage Bexan]|nr:hypothetical protein SEA_BEXAN_89 [Mycobacterium phage Bexan]
MRQRLGTEDAPSSMLPRLRDADASSGSTGFRIEGMPGFEIQLTFRDRSSRSTPIGSMDRGRVRRMLRAFGGRPARRMAAGISLRWGQPRCSRSVSWFEGGRLALCRGETGRRGRSIDR